MASGPPHIRSSIALAVLVSIAAACVTPAVAQVRSVDPDTAIDGDLEPRQSSQASDLQDSLPPQPRDDERFSPQPPAPAPAPADAAEPAARPVEAAADAAVDGRGATYHKDDLIGAAEGVFGQGAKGIADVIGDILKKQGEPNAYIVGREGGGAFAVGLRYGSGTLYHKVEGERPVYWTGPSIGFDAGANAGSAFILVYNLYDSEKLFQRFPAGEGQAYLIGGFNVSYMRSGDTVLIPVRVGAGLRLGANIGYMKFSHKQNWLPF